MALDRTDRRIKVAVADMQAYEAFLLGRLTRIDGVSGVHTGFVLRQVIAKTELPLWHNPLLAR